MDLFEGLPEPSTSTTQSGSTGSQNNDIPENSSSSEKPLETAADDITSEKGESDQQSSRDEKCNKRKLEDEKLSNGNVKKQKTVTYSIRSYLKERQGERDQMEDANVIIEDFTKEFTQLHPSIYRMSLYGVFDGHGGAKASRFASENLHKNLRDKFPKDEDIHTVTEEIRKTFIKAFKKTDEDFLEEAKKYKPPLKDGTTAILILVLNETMFIANIGDSQAVLCRYGKSAMSCMPIPLSMPHNPSLYTERKRIQEAGGHVKDGRVMGVLEVSRSIGDGQFKKLGVTCCPEVRKCQLQDTDRFVIVACDGLWKCFSPQESLSFVNEILQDKTIQGTEKKTAEEVRYDTACARLANEAVLRLSADNVTVLLLAISKNTGS